MTLNKAWTTLATLNGVTIAMVEQINQNELLLLGWVNDINIMRAYRYSQKEDRWSLIPEDDSFHQLLENGQLDESDSACSRSTRTLYFVNPEEDICAFNFTTGTTQIILQRKLGFGTPFAVFDIFGQVHILSHDTHWNDNRVQHFVLDTENGTQHLEYVFPHFFGIERSLETKSRKTKVVIAYSGENGVIHGSVWEYSLVHKTWTQHDLPTICFDRSSNVITNDGRFIIKLGGFYQKMDIIRVYDLETRTLFSSQVRCPAIAEQFFHSAMMHDSERDRTLTFGFVRECFTFVHVPKDIIKFIGLWLSTEEVHALVSRPCQRVRGQGLGEIWTRDHWKIDVDIILDSMLKL